MPDERSVGAKICGLTRPADAALAVAHGAVRLGVIFAGGPRQVTPSVAREIVAAAGVIPVLAVVRPEPASALLDLVGTTGVAGVQLHGSAPDSLVEELDRAGILVWRQVALGPGDALELLIATVMRYADAVLVEPRDADGGSGGRGLALDLGTAQAARRALAGHRMVLAGGLSPESVRQAIRRVQPDLVDVSSGVESAPGIKDPGRLVRFLEEVRDVRSPD